MINKKEKTTPTASSVVNVIGEGTTIEGNLISDGDIRIDGKVEGSIVTKAKCVIGQSAIVQGDVDARNCDVSGKIVGNAKVGDVLLIKTTGVITGDIRTAKLVVENGGEFNGSCTMGNSVSMSNPSKGQSDFNTSATA